MKREEIEKKAKEMVFECLAVEPEEIKLESKIEKDLGADSLDKVELLMMLEEDFNIEIPDEDAEKISTFGQIVDYLEKNLK